MWNRGKERMKSSHGEWGAQHNSTQTSHLIYSCNCTNVIYLAHSSSISRKNNLWTCLSSTVVNHWNTGFRLFLQSPWTPACRSRHWRIGKEGRYTIATDKFSTRISLSQLTGHPTDRSMYDTIRQEVYCPRITYDAYSTVTHFCAWARNGKN